MGKRLSEKTKVLATHYKKIVDHSKSLQNKCTYSLDYTAHIGYNHIRRSIFSKIPQVVRNIELRLISNRNCPSYPYVPGAGMV